MSIRNSLSLLRILFGNFKKDFISPSSLDTNTFLLFIELVDDLHYNYSWYMYTPVAMLNICYYYII